MVQLGPTALKSEMKFQIRVVEGRRAVMKLFLLGLHTCITGLVSACKARASKDTQLGRVRLTGWLQYAASNTSESCACSQSYWE